MPLSAMASALSHDGVVSRIKEKAKVSGLDVPKFTAMLDATAASLIDENPGLGPDYPIWVLPSRPYPEMYVRDSFWTLSGYQKKNYLATFVDIFSRNSQAADWKPPLAGQVPTIVRKHVPAPQDGRRFDESTMFWIVGAKLAGKTAATEPYLKQAHAFLKTLVTPEGYAMVSHGWIDAWEPVSKPVVSANNQGLFAVALHALQDMGVDVTSEERRAAEDAYRGLFRGGFLHAYAGRNVVDVSSLIGESLSLYLWDQPILSDEQVKGTVSKFAPVFYPEGDFLGFKCLSAEDGSYLKIDEFWTIAERDPGNYQNGASWFLYDVLAMYAAMRHDGADVYVDRFVGRLKSEVKYEYSSKEFICTGGTCGACDEASCYCPKGKCGIGGFRYGRSGYGWNLWVKRLLGGK